MSFLKKKLLFFTCTSLLHEALEIWRQIAFLIVDVTNSLIFSWDLLVPICTQQNSTYILTPFTVNKIGLKSGRFCSDFIGFYSLIEKHTRSPLLMWILGKKQLDVGKEKVPSFGFNGVHCVKIEARRWYDVVLYKQCMFAKFIMWICSYTGPSANVIVVARKKSC